MPDFVSTRTALRPAVTPAAAEKLLFFFKRALSSSSTVGYTETSFATLSSDKDPSGDYVVCTAWVFVVLRIIYLVECVGAMSSCGLKNPKYFGIWRVVYCGRRVEYFLMFQHS